MLKIIVFVLGLLCLLLLLSPFLQHKNVRCIREQPTYTNRGHSTLWFYSVPMDLQMKALCEEMQKLRGYYIQENMKVMQTDHNFKHLITNMSHDIRTPLINISGYLQMLGTAEGEEERQRCLQVIRARMTHLQDLLEELFSYTRPSSANIEFHPEPTRTYDMLDEVLLYYHKDFKQQELQVQLEVDPTIILTGDSVYLKRMLHSLCVNMLRHGFEIFVTSAK